MEQIEFVRAALAAAKAAGEQLRVHAEELEKKGMIGHAMNLWHAAARAGDEAAQLYLASYGEANASMEPFVVPAYAETLDRVLGTAFGYVSACWGGLQNAGVFYSTEAKQALDAVLEWCSDRGWSAGLQLVAAERGRQVQEEGFTREHDAEHQHGELAMAGACYALPGDVRPKFSSGRPHSWPWHITDWKPTPQDRKRELVKAAGLIIAELDRLVAEEEKAHAVLTEPETKEG